MRPMQDWRMWMVLLAGASLMLAGAVAFATGGYPGGAEQPTLPTVVTTRPLEPSATPLPPAVPSTAETSPSRPATQAPAAKPPASRPGSQPKPAAKPGTSAAPKPPATSAPKKEAPKREVITPDVREEEERTQDRSLVPASPQVIHALGGSDAGARSRDGEGRDGKDSHREHANGDGRSDSAR